PVELIDTAGLRPSTDFIESLSQSLGRGQAEQADLVLLCLEGGVVSVAEESALLERKQPPVQALATKSDLSAPPPGGPAVSVVTGEGLAELRDLLGEWARNLSQPMLAPSLSRCRHHVEGCLKNLRQAHSLVLFEEPAELLALELREALQQLGEMVGAVYTDDLLDRIFSRFCIGK
ncbi:MAG TPA: tRNA uridine-5-carboxymethylaminomethyl(34) synthesis GTPase MnmE, partial [Candidatus Xenobia bacterium]